MKPNIRIHDFRSIEQLGYTRVTTHWDIRQKAIAWCKEQFGDPGHTTDDAKWTYSLAEFWFENEQDAVFFALKWS